MNRAPDWILLGAMKAGTTSLCAWLGSHPSVGLPEVKEPNFFSDDRKWASGGADYERLFGTIAPWQITGEASVAYTDPRHGGKVAERIASLVPDAKLLFLSRDPVIRMRSHYLHEVKRGRERRTFLEAVSDDDSVYRTRSHYVRCLEPFIELDINPLLVVPMESVFDPGHRGWYSILAFLGLTEIAPLGTAVNVTSEKQQFRPAMRVAWHLGIRNPPDWVPRGVRNVGKRILLSDGRRRQQLVASASEEVPAEIRSQLEDEYARMWMVLQARREPSRRRRTGTR